MTSARVASPDRSGLWDLPVPVLSRLSGVATTHLYAYRRATEPMPAGTAAKLAAIAAAGPGSVVVRSRLTTPQALAAAVREDPHDPSYLVRLAKELTAHAGHLESPADVAAFFVEPVTTHLRGWDALIAGVAVLAAREHTSAPLAWARAPSRFADELWSPFGFDRWSALDYLDTPVELRRRSVLLAAGNLEAL